VVLATVDANKGLGEVALKPDRSGLLERNTNALGGWSGEAG